MHPPTPSTASVTFSNTGAHTMRPARLSPIVTSCNIGNPDISIADISIADISITDISKIYITVWLYAHILVCRYNHVRL
jgi:hypothetical protein